MHQDVGVIVLLARKEETADTILSIENESDHVTEDINDEIALVEVNDKGKLIQIILIQFHDLKSIENEK